LCRPQMTKHYFSGQTGSSRHRFNDAVNT